MKVPRAGGLFTPTNQFCLFFKRLNRRMGTPKNKAVSVSLGKTFHDHGKLQTSLWILKTKSVVIWFWDKLASSFLRETRYFIMGKLLKWILCTLLQSIISSVSVWCIDVLSNSLTPKVLSWCYQSLEPYQQHLCDIPQLGRNRPPNLTSVKIPRILFFWDPNWLFCQKTQARETTFSGGWRRENGRLVGQVFGFGWWQW